MAQFDPFENDFRQRASGMRRTPSPRTWNRIERRLDRPSTGRGSRMLGLRPWMIAALFLLLAGAVGLGTLNGTGDSPLAQRSETVEDLHDAFAPTENFDVEAYRTYLKSTELGTPGNAALPADFRDLTVAEKYQS